MKPWKQPRRGSASRTVCLDQNRLQNLSMLTTQTRVWNTNHGSHPGSANHQDNTLNVLSQHPFQQCLHGRYISAVCSQTRIKFEFGRQINSIKAIKICLRNREIRFTKTLSERIIWSDLSLYFSLSLSLLFFPSATFFQRSIYFMFSMTLNNSCVKGQIWPLKADRNRNCSSTKKAERVCSICQKKTKQTKY